MATIPTPGLSSLIAEALAVGQSGRHPQAEQLWLRLHHQCTERLAATPSDAQLRSEWVVVCVGRATNLQPMGNHGLAEELFAAVQPTADDLVAPDPFRWLGVRATLRVNRAVNLRSLGRLGQAERMFAEALDLLTTLQSTQPQHPGLVGERSHLLMNRAVNLQRLGRLDEADRLLAAAREGYESLLASAGPEAVLERLAAVEVNHANVLVDLRRYEAARASYDAALTARLAVRRELRDTNTHRAVRAAIRSNQAGICRATGQHGDAERIYVDIQDELDALRAHEPEHTGHQADGARIRVDRAENLLSMNRLAEADELLAQAQRIWDALAGRQVTSEALRAQRVRLALQRAQLDLRLHRHEQAGRQLQVAHTMLLQLTGAADVDVGRLLSYAACLTIRLQDLGLAPAVQTATQLSDLCHAAMDRLDLLDVEDGSAASGVLAGSSSGTAGLVELTISWLLEHADEGCDAVVPGLLASYHGRYAAAQRVLAAHDPSPYRSTGPAAAGIDVTAHGIHMLRLNLRVLQAQANYLLALPSDSVPNHSAALSAAMQRVDRCRQQLLDLQRNYAGAQMRSDLGLDELRAGLQPDRALVILLGLRALERPEAGEPGPARGVALVLRHGASRFDLVNLPDEVMSAARACDAASTAMQHPDGEDLRDAVASGWRVIVSRLEGDREVFIALHGVLALLPWQGAEDEAGDPRLLSVHHGISNAAHAMRSGGPESIAPPGPMRPLGVLAHSPPADDAGDPAPSSAERSGSRAMDSPIPGTYVDQAIALAAWPQSAHALHGRAELLGQMPALVQLSCHGDAHRAQTGPHRDHTWVAELGDMLRRQDRQVELVILMACCSARAQSNPWGESGGWAVTLHGYARLVLASLYPVSDLYAPLYIAMLHREWHLAQDLRKAVAAVRRRLRSGQWADSAEGLSALSEQWLEGIERHWPATSAAQMQAKALVLEQARTALSELPGHGYGRGTNDAGDRRLRLIAESMVLFG